MIKKAKIKKIIISAVAIVCLVGGILLGLYLGSRKTPADFLECDYSEDYSDSLITVDRTDKYLGHPDMVLTDTGRLIVVYPLGHGRGQIVMKYSDDMGATWSERVKDTPSSWASSQETPTIYNLKFANGDTKLVMISGCPYWNANTIDGVFLPEQQADGFNFTYSDDDGETWSEFEKFYSPMDCIVAMASLTQVKENGKFVDKWMGIFHDHDFVNYKTYLTFDENGKANWSTPEPFLSEHRQIESTSQMCEIEVIRSLDDTLILLARANSRKTRSMISISNDEGETWSTPKELPYILSGDRHKAEYDEATGKVFIGFRQIVPEKQNLLATKTQMCDGWTGWIGTFEELIDFAVSDNHIEFGASVLIGKNNNAWCDCGYSGVVCKDGYAYTVSYGCFSDDCGTAPYIAFAKVDLSE